MEGDPGSMSAYARGERNMFKGRDGPGPAAYSVKTDSITARNEVIPPFDTTAIRHDSYLSPGPGPIYFPLTKGRWQHGAVLFSWGDRFHEKIDFSQSCTDNEPVWGRIPDPWVMMSEKVLAMMSKRPRVSFEKYVSNNIPTIYHPLDIRCFVKGIDGREYPWRLNRIRSAAPSNYNTYKIYTSKSKITPNINFGAMAERRPLFIPQIGAGPAGYYVRGFPQQNRGEFLGKRFNDPRSSALRLFDILERQIRRDNFTGPAGPTISTSICDKCSPDAVRAPFKSKTPLGFVKAVPGPGPAAHFVVEMQESDLKKPLKPGLITFPPEKVSFDTTQERFIDPELYEMMDRPGPSDYDILGFADIMKRELVRHPAAIINPKLGFLTSADARPGKSSKAQTGGGGEGGGDINIVTQPPCHCLCEKPRRWRNIRPPHKAKTYGYNGQPPKFPDSPGPIYDSAPGAAALKCHKSWLDPRHHSRMGFLNSGCQRKTDFFHIDRGVPGPGKYFATLACCRRHSGKRPESGPRFKDYSSVGPGPVHRFHEKRESSMWRASHLGTFNSNLKHVGILYPSAGGYRKKNLDQAGDRVWKIKRGDDYAYALCPKSIEQPRTSRTTSEQSQNTISGQCM